MDITKLATVEEVKENLIDKISSDLGLVLGDNREVREMIYLAYILGSRDDGLAYFNAVEESNELLSQPW